MSWRPPGRGQAAANVGARPPAGNSGPPPLYQVAYLPTLCCHIKTRTSLCVTSDQFKLSEDVPTLLKLSADMPTLLKLSADVPTQFKLSAGVLIINLVQLLL